MREEATFVLRAWRDGGDWHASLEDLRSARRWVFGDLESCWAFVQERLASPFAPQTSSQEAESPEERQK
jgi:hypothetical protein